MPTKALGYDIYQTHILPHIPAFLQKKMLHRELNPCTDKEWPGKTEPQNSLPGPKRQVKVIAWSPASGGGYRRNSAARAPVPRGMEEYFKRLGVDVSDGLIST